MTDIHDHNEQAWDRRARDGRRFAKPAKVDDLHDPLKTVDGIGWITGGVAGKRLLALAAGGGKHSALYAAAGAAVTVVDISRGMLALDQRIADEQGLDITPVHASMDDLSSLGDAIFDVVIHPVSTCYLPDVAPVYREVARVIKPGGLYISQHKQPTSMQADTAPTRRGYEIVQPYHKQGPLPAVTGSLHREEGTIEFLHTWEQLLGHMCEAGFVIEAITEPRHADAKGQPGSFKHRSCFVPPYIRIKARRTQAATPPAKPAIVLP